MHYDLIESTDKSNISIKITFITRKNKTGTNAGFGKGSHKSFKEPRYYFIVVENGKIIKNNNGTVEVASNNHEESDTLLRYCLGIVDLENKAVCVKSNDTDILTIMLANYKKLNGLTILIAWSNEKWVNLAYSKSI